jgi:hypothetical protein
MGYVGAYTERLKSPVRAEHICGSRRESQQRKCMMTKPIRKIAMIGTGAIGASWTALFFACQGVNIMSEFMSLQYEKNQAGRSNG